MQLTLVRHGETESNRSGVFQTTSSGLSEKGLRQVQQAASVLGQADIIITSSLTRAVETAEAIGKKQRAEIQQSGLLQEVRLPTKLNGLGSASEDFSEYKRQFVLQSFDHQLHDAETYEKLMGRASEFLNFVVALNIEHVIAISHGMFIKTLLGTVILSAQFTPELFFPFQERISIKNASLTKLKYNNGWKVIELNNTEHLR